MSAPSSILASLARLVHLIRTAPDDLTSQERAFRGLAPLVAQDGIRFGADGRWLTAAGRPLPQGTPHAEELGQQLVGHGVGEIELPAGLPSDQLLALVRELAKPFQNRKGAADFSEALEKQGVDRITVRGPRELPAADSLISLERISGGDSVQHQAPSLDELYGVSDQAGLGWEQPPAGQDDLRAAQTKVDQAAARNDWAEVLSLLGGMVDSEAAATDQAEAARLRRAVRATMPRARIRELARLSASGRRQEVAKVFASVGAEATATLVDMLAEAENRDERSEYYTLLTRMEAGSGAIINRLHDDRWYVVRNIAELCGELDLVEAAPQLATALTHEDVRVRRAVAGTLASFGARAAEPLRQALRDPDPTVRLHAARELGGARSRGLAMTLKLVLEEEAHVDVRRELFLALGRIGTPESLAVLADAARPGGRFFGRKPAPERLMALEALGLCGPAARRVLAELADDSTRAVAELAGRLLGNLD